MTATPAFMDESMARDEICRVGRSLFERGYVHATAGNISVRLADGYLITPTDACLGTLQPERLARLDAQGQQVSGDRASKTITLHRQIYEASASTAAPARCVIHTHSTHLVACSLQATAVPGVVPAAELLPALTPYFVMKVGRVPHIPYHRPGSPDAQLLPPITPYFVMKVGRVPHIPYHRPGDAAAAAMVAQAITRYAAQGSPVRAVMLARLGPNVWHDTPAAAMAVLEELEETARLWMLCQPRPTPLNERQIEELRQAFGAQW